MELDYSIESCKDYWEKQRFQNGIYCIHCESHDKIYTTNRGYKCSKCLKKFSISTGTIFEGCNNITRLFLTIRCILNRKLKISSIKLSKIVGCTQSTAWYLKRKIMTIIRFLIDVGEDITFNNILLFADSFYYPNKNKEYQIIV